MSDQRPENPVNSILLEETLSTSTETVDKSRRNFWFSFGSLLGTLSACAAPQNPDANPGASSPEKPVDYQGGQQNAINTVNQDFCNCVPGVQPPIGLPTPPDGTFPTPGPGGPIGGAPAPAPANPVTPGPAPTPAPAEPTPAPAPAEPVPTPAPAPAPGEPGPTPAPAPAPGEPGPTPAPAPAPTPAPAPAPADPATGLLPAQTFTSLGPGIINLQATDMMAGITQRMSDGRQIIVWGFLSNGGQAFNNSTDRICPGPVVEAIEGQPTTLALRSMHPHSVHLHGLDVTQANDGVPTTSGYVSGMMGPAPGIPRPAGTNLGPLYEYRFTPLFAGTYLYHCHVDTVLHMEMGMSGTVIVRPADGNKNTLWTDGPAFDREYIWQLHTFDSRWHSSSLASGPNTSRYTPDYFMLNGRDGNDLFTDSASAIVGNEGQTIALRLVNIGYQPAVIRLGEITFDVVASDGRPLATAISGQSEIMVAPGERYDILFTLPAMGVNTATIHYYDIQGMRVLGTAVTSVTSFKPV